MNQLFVRLNVKFRAFGITFGTLNRDFHIPLPLPMPVPGKDLLNFNERGVTLIIKLI